jgi:site-specific recombinase XerD
LLRCSPVCDCKLSSGTIEGRTAALRFLFVKTLRRPYLPDHIPFPKRQARLPTVLSQKEVARLIASAQNLMHRTNDLAPISDAAWARIEEETSRTFKRHLAGWRVVDMAWTRRFDPIRRVLDI